LDKKVLAKSGLPASQVAVQSFLRFWKKWQDLLSLVVVADLQGK
jgi:hypothetical protein